MWGFSIIWVHLAFSRYLHQRERVPWNSESTPPALHRREHWVWPQKTITLSCEFLIWLKKHYLRPSHNLLMTSSNFKCQVLIFAAPPERNYCLMRNMGRHLHPRTCDTWEVLSPPTWNLPHIKLRGQIKYSPRILQSQNQSWTTGSRENQQLAHTCWVSNAQGSRYQGGGRDGDEPEEKEN